ncbi:MAG: SDR family oxidoreductase [Polyangiaceae bacterium]|nr:SDR family oxidoreductase [Polyangiaceae bacterium]
MDGPVVVMSGASSGLGFAAATYLAARGYRVIGGGLGFPDPSPTFDNHALDVCDGQSVQRFIATAMASTGRIDALVNCAGIQLSGALEVMAIAEAQRILDTNLLGTVRLCQEVLPILRAQGAGKIVNVSSLGGRLAFPFHTMYCASKFAVEGLTECLRYELRPFGIHVSLLEPGSFRTPLSETHEWSVGATNDTIYVDTMRRVVEINQARCRKSADLLPFARRLETILRSKRPRLRYVAAAPDQRPIPTLRRFLPDNWLEWLVRRNFRLE